MFLWFGQRVNDTVIHLVRANVKTVSEIGKSYEKKQIFLRLATFNQNIFTIMAKRYFLTNK